MRGGSIGLFWKKNWLLRKDSYTLVFGPAKLRPCTRPFCQRRVSLGIPGDLNLRTGQRGSSKPVADGGPKSATLNPKPPDRESTRLDQPWPLSSADRILATCLFAPKI